METSAMATPKFKNIPINFHIYAGIFSGVLRGRNLAPVPIEIRWLFSQFWKKIPIFKKMFFYKGFFFHKLHGDNLLSLILCPLYQNGNIVCTIANLLF